MNFRKYTGLVLWGMFLVSGCSYKEENLVGSKDIIYTFKDVSVHDPSIIKEDDTYYIFGSHLAAAKTKDFMNWSMIGNGANAANLLFDNVKKELAKTFEWAQTKTLWAPDVIKLKDGRYYMYYCACQGSSPLSSMGIAVADTVEGPYKDLGIILKSGMDSDILSEDGDIYNASYQPNVVDPDVFYDKEGRLWMIYGSYSGGIFALELNPDTGYPLNSGYGKKLLGENHLRIEGAYILYSEESGYYYMFLSFGGLAADGGYNIRVVRSKSPDGPYFDSEGNDMIDCKGDTGTFFDDTAAEKFGTKIMGNYRFNWVEGERGEKRNGYVSPGHCSAIYDHGKYYLIFHTRFENLGEAHKVRVHQMFLNEDDWFVVAPYRYTGETIKKLQKDEVIGTYKIIRQGHDISNVVKESDLIKLKKNGKISGKYRGNWEMAGGNQIIIKLDGETYKGIVLKQWDEYGLKNVMAFSALAENGSSILGSGLKAIEP